MENYDCIIIGAGLSGLAAGIRLAHFNKKVLICEQHLKIGGLNSYYTISSHEMETGLHAMTNFATKNAPKTTTLLKLLRQLRIPYDALLLREQNSSSIRFPGKKLCFSNDYAMLEESIAENFPNEIDKFRKFDAMIMEFDELNLDNKNESARKTLDSYLGDSLLKDMLMCPMMYYGSASGSDMDFSMMAVLYKSILKEGMSRPTGQGIRLLLKLLKERYLESGGELALNCEILKINEKNGRAKSVETKRGTFSAKQILSSAGHIETLRLCGSPPPISDVHEGNISFVETIAAHGDEIKDYGTDETIIFFNDNPDGFRYEKPETPIDNMSGIICLPQNFQFQKNDVKPGKAVRTSTLANPDYWLNLHTGEYVPAKEKAASEILKETEKIIGVKDLEKNALLIDTVTPKTFKRFTGHLNGAIYGSPQKLRKGKTHLENLFICGTDQGFLGITGAMFSGVTIANIYLLK
jgi:phytoene dehydrogenase-like protein